MLLFRTHLSTGGTKLTMMGLKLSPITTVLNLLGGQMDAGLILILRTLKIWVDGLQMIFGTVLVNDILNIWGV